MKTINYCFHPDVTPDRAHGVIEAFNWWAGFGHFTVNEVEWGSDSKAIQVEFKSLPGSCGGYANSLEWQGHTRNAIVLDTHDRRITIRAAHEIGHIILRQHGHSPSGIMAKTPTEMRLTEENEERLQERYPLRRVGGVGRGGGTHR